MKYEQLIKISLDHDILKLHSNSHIRRKYIRSILDKELLYDLYVTKNMTSLNISIELEKLGIVCSVGTYIDIAAEFGIPTPTHSDAANKSMNRRVATNIEKFGAINSLSSGTIGYHKRNDTVEKKYGVTNVFQLDSIKQKSYNTNIKKYGLPFPQHAPIKGTLTKPHVVVLEYLDYLNISYIIDPRNKFSKYNEYLDRIYSPVPDVYIPDKKIIIEIYGDYYHANPIFYKETDILKIRWNNVYNITGKFPIAKNIWDEDNARIEQLKSFGNKCLILWENDIANNLYKDKIDDILR